MNLLRAIETEVKLDQDMDELKDTARKFAEQLVMYSASVGLTLLNNEFKTIIDSVSPEGIKPRGTE